jgi:hypothetical protein
MDHLAITTDTIKNYIPIGYKKEEPENFFNIVYDHAEWMNTVRHITITNVPTTQDFKETTNSAGKTLESIIRHTVDIDHFVFMRNQRSVQVAVQPHKIQRVTDRIKEAMSTEPFPFKPQIAKRLNPTGSLGSSKSGTSKYSAAMAKYQTERSPNASVATSIGEDVSRLTNTTRRSWSTQQRKIPKEIDFTDETAFPTIQALQPPTETRNKQPTSKTLQDESITDTTVIQQAIDTALKKAYEEHRQEVAELQAQFNRQLELIQKQQNTASLESKVDRLMELLLMDKQEEIIRESPIRKKGRPTNLEQSVFSQSTTPTRSNRHHTETTEDTTMMDETEEEAPMGPHFDPADVAAAIAANSSTGTNGPSQDFDPKTKKEKKYPKMTQTKLVDMMQDGVGYGQPRGSPPRTGTTSPSRLTKHTPPRTGKGTPPRPIQAAKASNSAIANLTKLSSTRSGHSEPHGREN